MKPFCRKPEKYSLHLRPNLLVPLDLLATEWLDDSPKSAETRLYLVEQVLPTLVLGLEGLLQQADQGEDEDFNALNWLAQWLTRSLCSN